MGVEEEEAVVVEGEGEEGVAVEVPQAERPVHNLSSARIP